MTLKTHKSARCPLCSTTVIVWRMGALPASLLRALALVDHVRVSHPAILTAELEATLDRVPEVRVESV